MRRSIILVLAIFSGIGCDRFDETGLQMTANVIPDDACVISADNAILPAGLWDLSFPAPYFVFPRLESKLVSRATDVQAEMNTLQVTGIEVELVLPDGSLVPIPEALNNPYSVTTTAVLTLDSADAAAADAIPVSYQDSLLELLPPNPTLFDRAEIRISMRAFGNTLGGLEVNGTEFLFPVTLCAGCLENCDSMDTVCTPGQDGDPYCLVGP